MPSSATSARTEQTTAAIAATASTDAQRLPAPEPKPAPESVVDAAALAALRSSHPDALATSRQVARFLAGITSPATTRAKLTRDARFGALADRRFADVLAWCDAAVS